MKNRKVLFIGFTLTCLVAAGVCLIVNIAINRQITWAVYPLLSIPFGWASLSPLFVKKHGFVLHLCALMLLVFPYLYLLSKITPVTDWFMPIGVPSAIAGIIALGILYPLFRFTKMNVFHKFAITFFLLGGIISPVVNYFVDIYLGVEPFAWYRYFSVFSCIIASAALGILGYVKSKQKPANKVRLKP